MPAVCDYSKILKGHPGKWVALSSDGKKIVAVGTTVKDVMRQASAKKEPSPILTKTPEDDGALVII
jgi:hypothetical protein